MRQFTTVLVMSLMVFLCVIVVFYVVLLLLLYLSLILNIRAIYGASIFSDKAVAICGHFVAYHKSSNERPSHL